MWVGICAKNSKIRHTTIDSVLRDISVFFPSFRTLRSDFPENEAAWFFLRSFIFRRSLKNLDCNAALRRATLWKLSDARKHSRITRYMEVPAILEISTLTVSIMMSPTRCVCMRVFCLLGVCFYHKGIQFIACLSVWHCRSHHIVFCFSPSFPLSRTPFVSVVALLTLAR